MRLPTAWPRRDAASPFILGHHGIPDRMTPIDLMHYTLALAFLAVCLLAAVIVVREGC